MKSERALEVVRKMRRFKVRTVAAGDDFIRRDEAVIGYWAYGRARLLSSRVPVIYKSEALRTCGGCGRIGWDSVRQRSADSRHGYPELYEWSASPLCSRCYISAARRAILAERSLAAEDEAVWELEKLVREYRIVVSKPIQDRAFYAQRFNERVRPTSVEKSQVV